MSRPGTEIISREQPLPRSAPTDTGVWFVTGDTASGPTTPTLVTSLTQYEATFGDRSGGADLYDAIDAYFREGGAKVYVRAFPAGTMLLVSRDELEPLTRDELNTRAEAAGIDDPASLPNKDAVIDAIIDADGEVAAPQASTPTDLADALDDFTSDLGPGQVSIPGASDAASQQAILEHCAAHNRIGLLEAAEAGTAQEVIDAAATLRALPEARYGALFAPQAVIPGVAAGTTRNVPCAAIEAGLIARNDALFNPNVPAAGTNGLSRYATDLSARYTDAEYEQLNEGGIDMFRLIYGGVEAYGYRTLVDPDDPDAAPWLSLGNARLNMAIVAQADVIAERFVFSVMDGRGRTVAQFGAELRAMLVPFYEADALYGATADEAFYVDVGDQVNTPESIAAGELHAVIEVRMSPFAELVVIEIVKVATTQALAA